MPTSDGTVAVRGSLSYSPQEAWVFGGSVRANILFGEQFEEKRYWEVVEACALAHDFSQWEHRDATLVGERGVALSGGQKARVTLARACYRRAATYLLDDPLSAVDAHVGKHLFEKCIQGLLRDKVSSSQKTFTKTNPLQAVLLVTHQLQYLREADEIVVLAGGRCGVFSSQMSNQISCAGCKREETSSTSLRMGWTSALSLLKIRRKMRRKWWNLQWFLYIRRS